MNLKKRFLSFMGLATLFQSQPIADVPDLGRSADTFMPPSYGGGGYSYRRRMISPKARKLRKRRRQMFKESRKHETGKK